MGRAEIMLKIVNVLSVKRKIERLKNEMPNVPIRRRTSGIG